MMLRVVLLEVKDVLDLCTAERIDGLGVVADHTEILVELAQLLEYQILRKVGILILIDHDIVESARYRFHRRRVVTQQDVHVQEDIVEVHDTCLLAFMGIELINIADARFLGRCVILKSVRVATVRFGGHQIVLRHRNAREHILWLIHLLIQLKFLQTCLDRTDRISRVIDGKCRRITQ